MSSFSRSKIFIATLPSVWSDIGVMNQEIMRSNRYWLESLLCIPFSDLMLMVGQQEGEASGP